MSTPDFSITLRDFDKEIKDFLHTALIGSPGGIQYRVHREKNLNLEDEKLHFLCLSRNKKLIGSSLEAEVYVHLGDKYLKGLVENIEMKKVLIVSEFVLLNDKNEKIDDSLYEEKDTQEDLLVFVKKASNLKCLRCWQYDKLVEEVQRLCPRCKEALELNA